MNQGLKSYTKQIECAAGGVAKFYFNANQNCANTHLIVPILNTIGHNPISLNLIYNYQDRNVINQFGKGFKLNYYAYFDGEKRKNADGSEDSFVENVMNKETKETLTIETSPYAYYELMDQEGNYTRTDTYDSYYPKEIVNYKGEKINIQSSQNQIISISNEYGDIVEFTTTSTLVTITYKYNSTVLSTVKLTISNNLLTTVKYYEGSSTLIKEVLLECTDSNIVVRDNIRKEITKVNINSGLPHTAIKGFVNDDGVDSFENLNELMFYYQSYKTVVTNKRGQYQTFYFDGGDYPIFEKDMFGKIQKYQYDLNTKSLLKNEAIKTDAVGNKMHNVNISQFSRSNQLTLTNVDVVSGYEAINELFGNELKNISGTGQATYTVNLSGKAGDVVSLSFLMGYFHINKNVVSVAILLDGEGSSYIISSSSGVMELQTICEQAKKDFSSVTVRITFLSNTTVRIGAFTLLKNQGVNKMTYSSDKLSMIEAGKDSVSLGYTNGNLVQSVATNEGKTTTVTYNSNKRVEKTQNEVGTKNENTYHSTYKDKVVSQRLVSANGLMSINSNNTYTTDGRFVSSTSNEFGKLTSFEYDTFGRVKKVTDALGKVLNVSYYKNMLSALTLTGSKTASQSNTYDTRNRLKQIITAGGSVYTFDYTFKNQLKKVVVDGDTIEEYIYDNFGNVNRLTLSSSGEYYEFEYDSKDNIEYIKFNGVNKYYFEYDEKDRLWRINDLTNQIVKIYVFDEYDRIIKENVTGSNVNSEIENDFGSGNKNYIKSRLVNGKRITESFNELKPKNEIYSGDTSNVKEVNFIQGNIDTYGSYNQNLFEISPLHTSTKTISGSNAEYEFIKTNDDTLFTFNDYNKRYCFDGNKGVLKYLTNISGEGTIFARVFIPNFNADQQIFSLSNDVLLIATSSKNLELIINGVSYSTSLEMQANTWHTVALSFTNISSGERQYRVYLDYATEVFTENNASTFTSLIAQIGSLSTDTYQFTGQMEMFAYRNSYSTVADIDVLKGDVDNISYRTVFDEFNRPTNKEIYMQYLSIIRNRYSYKAKDDNAYNTSKIINQESIYLKNNGLTTRNYGYDSLNRITSITDPVFGNKTYGYDDRGFLTNDSGTTISYDNNGNITAYGTKEFKYEGAFKDQLTSVGGKVITYSSTNAFLPVSYDGYAFNWLGKELQSVSKSGVTYNYYYDECGLRIKKSSSTGETKYFYDGDRLITEINPSNRLDFLYDSSGLLIGFVLNNNYKYLYVRDILQNILGIVDGVGNLVVKYSYNAYGEVSIVSDTSGRSIGTVNPFKYKGYYYDVETQLFYCNSRYYSPELCRFISPDSIEYLKPQNINGLNLYAYCGNDPINKYDPTGHFAISILAFIIIGAALATAVAVTDGARKEETMVIDLSYSIPNTIKFGGSLVLDFKGKNIEIYPHVGQAYGISSGLSYSIGKVWNYSKPGSYGGFFAFGGGGFLIGFDGCFNPLKPSGASATSITFSTSASLYGGWDWYFDPISFNYERWEFNKIKEED